MKTIIHDYMCVYGKPPKGFGNWAFDVCGTDGEGRYTSEVVWATGRFAEARKQAVREFKAMVPSVKTVVSVIVLP